jgi:hypothetical protein
MNEEVTAEAEVTTTESVDTSTEKSTDAPESDAKAEESKDQTENTDAAEAESEKPKVDPKKAEKSYKKREARRNRDRIRELESTNERLLKAVESKPQTQPDKPPKIEDFESMDEYLDARDSFRDSNKESGKAENSPTNQADGYDNYVTESRDELMEAGSDKYEDFVDVVTDKSVKMTPTMRDAIFEMDDQDLQIEAAYFLANNPKEAGRITKLSGIRQIKEIGKLEAKLSNKTTPKRPSTAPKPVSPVGGAKTSADAHNPKDDFETFKKKRNKELGR